MSDTTAKAERVVKGPSVDELIQQQQEALQALLARKREEDEARVREEEASLTPEQRIMRAVEKRLAHMDAQIVRLGGHSYRLYDL